ncbi:Phosphoserine aminotransferase (plasmid) [Cupriavidus taiwanensis]|uniref:Phosphoserine aminotransferase n=2 Tax=Cupriavidus taiwanensis TaxID=164546 RepID=A0A375IPK1_9BURK|nr:Phosphoserine aminotransferase [Cupriavidus taiwanensis]
MLSYQESGIGPMEMSHRTDLFLEIMDSARETLRELLEIPQSHDILFMQGGGIAQNAIVPLNLMGHRNPSNPVADFVVSGTWSRKTETEASKYGKANRSFELVARSPLEHLNVVPELFSENASYVHVCSNETIEGVEIRNLAQFARSTPHPIVVDASSNMLSTPVDFSQVGVLYAGAQKNAGIAGLTIVVVRKDLMGHAHPFCPSAFDWRLVSEHCSMYNTPPTYGIYIAGLVFRWIRDNGGVVAMERQSFLKSSALYDCIDRSALFANHIDPSYRSRINVPFHLEDRSLEGRFLEQAEIAGLVHLKGHKSTGGFRASLYNAMPSEGVTALVEFMREFERKA